MIMKKKIVSMAFAAFIALSASAMIMGMNYQKVSDKDCNKCSYTLDFDSHGIPFGDSTSRSSGAPIRPVMK